jgi:hypothetical protein
MSFDKKDGCKWDSAVNIILLIMFALVLFVMSLKGCSWCGEENNPEKTYQQGLINNTDSLLKDSVVDNQINGRI